MIERLDWDSAFFGFEVGALKATDGHEAAATISRERHFRLVYVRSVKELGFPGKSRFGECRMTFERRVGHDDKSMPAGIEAIQDVSPAEYKRLLELALLSGRYSRFRLDPGISHRQFTALYEAWLKGSLIKRLASTVLVHRDEATINGFATVVRQDDDTARIGLIAVAPEQQGRGIGRLLLAGALQATRETGNTRLKVTTQLQNAEAVSLYMRAGFCATERAYNYHYWI